MRTIWKYELQVNIPEAIISMPAEAKIIHVACQNPNIVSYWAEIETERYLENRHFKIFGTGDPIPISNITGVELVPIGTVLDGEFVWHLYEELQEG